MRGGPAAGAMRVRDRCCRTSRAHAGPHPHTPVRARQHRRTTGHHASAMPRRVMSTTVNRISGLPSSPRPEIGPCLAGSRRFRRDLVAAGEPSGAQRAAAPPRGRHAETPRRHCAWASSYDRRSSSLLTSRASVADVNGFCRSGVASSTWTLRLVIASSV